MSQLHHSKKIDQTGENPVSAATVKSAGLNGDRKMVVGKKEATKRKAYLISLEADAQAFVRRYRTAKEINDEAIVIHRKFRDIVEEMRPVFDRVKFGFAHLKKGETVMGKRTGPAWAEKYVGVSYDWLCRCLKPPKVGTLLLPDGTTVFDPTPPKSNRMNTINDETPFPKLVQSLPTAPPERDCDWTDNLYITTCVRFIESTLRPLESDPKRFHRVARAIAKDILHETGSKHHRRTVPIESAVVVGVVQ